jgi:hypothetical protein
MRESLFCMLVCTLLTGCSLPTKQWSGEQKVHVWTAMIAAAKAPDYSATDPRKRWVVVENNVDVNASLSRIVVRRKLARSLQLPRQNEQNDTRDWLFVIKLLPEQSPTVTFDVPETQLVPARSLDEADRYFSQVDELLQPEL